MCHAVTSRSVATRTAGPPRVFSAENLSYCRLFLRGISRFARKDGEGLQHRLEFLAQVLPFRVNRLDQGDFLRSSPPFDFLFPSDGGARGRVPLQPNQLVQVVPPRKSVHELCFVLPNPFREVSSDADVKHARFPGKHVDVERPLHSSQTIQPSFRAKRDLCAIASFGAMKSLFGFKCWQSDSSPRFCRNDDPSRRFSGPSR
jgi:hypothetical protein